MTKRGNFESKDFNVDSLDSVKDNLVPKTKTKIVYKEDYAWTFNHIPLDTNFFFHVMLMYIDISNYSEGGGGKKKNQTTTTSSDHDRCKFRIFKNLKQQLQTSVGTTTLVPK